MNKFTEELKKLEKALNNDKFSTDIKKAEEILKKHVGFAEEKEQAKNYVKLNYISAGRFRPAGKVICYAGPPGIGKTTFVQTLKEAMGRELKKIDCAGLKLSAKFSIRGNKNQPGFITQTIIEKDCKNPIILFDELEKVADEQIQKDLIWLFEQFKEGKKITDPYFQKEIDLGDITFFAAVNYPQKLSPKWKNLVEMHELGNFTDEEKKEILKLKKKEIENLYPQEREDIIPEEIIDELLEHIQEAGIRQAERVLHKIESEYIYSQENRTEFLVRKDPKKWLRENVLTFREEFKPSQKHYFLFILWGTIWILLIILILKKIILKDPKNNERTN